MAPAVVVSGGKDFEGRTTFYVVICGIVAACGGLMFGYDVGISGGVTSMDDFLQKFFHSVYERKHRARENNYCKFDDQRLQLFTSSLYLAAIVTSFFASKACNKFGRKPTMQAASLFFLLGTICNCAAVNVEMLIVGRLLLGVGVGCANSAVPLFLSEMAHVKIRGALNILFQLDVTIGILFANIVNYYTSKMHPNGWRVALGLAGIPAIMLCLGSLLISETPTSLIERGKYKEGLSTLKKIRGTVNVEPEYNELILACEVAKQVKDPFRSLMKRDSRPPLVIGILMQIFQQFTGINAIMFYAPVLFQTVGLESNGSLLSSVIIGSVNVACTIVSVVAVDRVGRRGLLLSACAIMLTAQTTIGGILLKDLGPTNQLHHTVATVVVSLVCLFVGSFAWSWGPLGWLIPSETFPLETRTEGFAFAVSSNMLFTFIIAQGFLSMMCHMQASIFFFFSAWIVVMCVFVIFFLPETKNVPIDEMYERVWSRHWYWKRYMEGGEEDVKVDRVESGLAK